MVCYNNTRCGLAFNEFSLLLTYIYFHNICKIVISDTPQSTFAHPGHGDIHVRYSGKTDGVLGDGVVSSIMAVNLLGDSMTTQQMKSM